MTSHIKFDNQWSICTVLYVLHTTIAKSHVHHCQSGLDQRSGVKRQGRGTRSKLSIIWRCEYSGLHFSPQLHLPSAFLDLFVEILERLRKDCSNRTRLLGEWIYHVSLPSGNRGCRNPQFDVVWSKEQENGDMLERNQSMAIRICLDFHLVLELSSADAAVRLLARTSSPELLDSPHPIVETLWSRTMIVYKFTLLAKGDNSRRQPSWDLRQRSDSWYLNLRSRRPSLPFSLLSTTLHHLLPGPTLPLSQHFHFFHTLFFALLP